MLNIVTSIIVGLAAVWIIKIQNLADFLLLVLKYPVEPVMIRRTW